ncbi:MAG TPA: hypothetical protein PKJ41_14060 [Bryobacteraceae bacterium]|nr:hypothetical protein [Bryobacteraceae bacterium]HPT25177.1 hypothetical protein [Bryobacteraceae bacterium]
MIPFDNRQLSSLEWRQESAFGRKHHLMSGDSALAEIHFVKTLGTLAEARTASSAWSFKRKGVFTSTVGARPLDEEREIAIYHPNWTSHKGLLRLENGEEYLLRSANLWASEWVLSDGGGEPLLRFHNKGFLKHGAQLVVEERAKSNPQLPFLITFAWYILLLHQMDSSAAAGA